MTKQEFAEYERSFRRGLKGLTHVSSGACAGCADCCEDYEYDANQEEFQVEPENWFSKSSCEICSCSLAGDRYPVHAIDKDGNIVHLDACPDCVYYNEYGQLDNTTMIGLG